MRSADSVIVRLSAFLLVLLTLAGCASHPPEVSHGNRQEWIETTLQGMTLADKAGQMISSRAYGFYYGGNSDEFQRLLRLVRQEHVGGFTFFQGEPLETAALIDKLQSVSKVPLLIALDAEWGMAMRIRRATRFPEAMAIGATGNPDFARAAGAATGSELRAVGIVQDFAPDADVNVNPDNPVINTRSFGENPRLVGVMASAFASGLQSAGVMATAKHFPGHGDTRVDSHLDLPLISHSRARLDSIELVPFRQLIKDGVASVMIAHLEVPAIEGDQKLPATLSSRMVDGFLKKELGFNGLVVTDAMDMGAIINNFGVDSSVIKAVEAGVDIVLIPSDETKAVAAITSAVKTGLITEARIDQSVRKILGVKWDHQLGARRNAGFDGVWDSVAAREHLALAKTIARASITLVKNDSVLPIPRGGRAKLLNVIVADADNYRTEINRSTIYYPNEPVGDYFTAQLRRRFTDVRTVRIDPTSDSLELHAVLRQAKGVDCIVLPVFCRARSGSGSFGLTPELVKTVDSLTRMNIPSVVLAMGTPYLLGGFPAARAALCAWSDAEFAAEAAVEAMAGEIPIHGRMPVTIPGCYPVGCGIDMEQSVLRRDVPENTGMNRDSLTLIDTVIVRAIRDSAFPGAEVAVIRNGALIVNKAFGGFEYAVDSPRVTTTTMYDCASLTKVIATTSSLMRLYDEQMIALDTPVVGYIPEFTGPGKEHVTIRNLLLHNGGLPAFRPLYRTVLSPEEALDSVYHAGLIYPPGDSTIYSDFDFILLGKVVERITGKPIDRYFDSVFAKPLGMTRTMFRPSAALRENIAPTEIDQTFRHGLVQGVVHDENAFVLGGVSGHAGLFSTASDIAVLMQMLMNGGTYGGVSYLKPSTVTLFTSKQGSGTRALGWDTKTIGGYSTAGTFFGPRSFGHTGFTGTSIWADPDRNVTVIFLTNRVYPTRENMKISHVRPALHDAVMRAVIR